ncbi:MAG: hypothetical protein A2283_19390 [Lentisphaerae bacterium RIFOXYA12_FULL_48_11]|nr:MAG: hypothetical protein A2283_19390 [Lentisphaerae bacterium RIFOXYA12_FULL_48_11]
MNLRVDLILETEQRSASVVNLKGIVRIISIVVPVILIVCIALVASTMMRINSELKNREGEMAIAGPKKDAAIKYREELGKNKQTLEELEGWCLSRIDWANQLAKIQTFIPTEIQLTSLKLMHSIETIDGTPARTVNMAMKGKALGSQANANVEMLGDIEKNTAFTNVMKEAKVADYRKNEDPSANEGEMLFVIEAIYQPKKFK